jgi:DNA-binding NarL/FixJ family response regulator
MTLAQAEFAIAHRSRRRLTLVSPTSSPTPTLRVVIAGGSTLLRAGFRALLESESNVAVAGEAGPGDEAVALAQAARPDVVLMCPAAPGFDAVGAIQRIAAQSHAGVIVLSDGGDDELAFDALRAGARGFLPLDSDPAELVRAVRTVAGGDPFLSPEVMRTLIAELTAYRTGRPALALV